MFTCRCEAEPSERPMAAIELGSPSLLSRRTVLDSWRQARMLLTLARGCCLERATVAANPRVLSHLWNLFTLTLAVLIGMAHAC